MDAGSTIAYRKIDHVREYAIGICEDNIEALNGGEIGIILYGYSAQWSIYIRYVGPHVVSIGDILKERQARDWLNDGWIVHRFHVDSNSLRCKKHPVEDT